MRKSRGTHIISDGKRYSPAEVEAFVRDNPDIVERPAPIDEVPVIIPDLIMVKRGRPINPAPLRLIVSNDEQRQALSEHQAAALELERTMQEEKDRLRRERKAEEDRRVTIARRKREKELTGGREVQTMQTDGRTHTVKKVKTTASKMVDSGKLPRDLYSQLTAFARVCASALGVAVDDDEDSTAKLISQYDGMGGGAFGSRTPHDSMLDARTALREIGALIPPQLSEVFVQIVGEEVGSLMSKPRTLDQIGEMRGYSHKQASASGGTQVYDVVAMIAHLAKVQGVISRENLKGLRQSVAQTQKPVGQQGETGEDGARLLRNRA